jgi:hypothetical protein
MAPWENDIARVRRNIVRALRQDDPDIVVFILIERDEDRGLGPWRVYDGWEAPVYRPFVHSAEHIPIGFFTWRTTCIANPDTPTS